MKPSKDACKHCGDLYENHEHCPGCGYTWCDVQIFGDHSICGRPQPKPPKKIIKREREKMGNCGSVMCIRHGIQESICLKCHEEIVKVPYDGKDMIGVPETNNNIKPAKEVAEEIWERVKPFALNPSIYEKNIMLEDFKAIIEREREEAYNKGYDDAEEDRRQEEP